MVLQLANNEDLREYLKINFSKLEWTDKLRMAREILDGLKFLHKNNIILENLCSWNARYIDPQCFKINIAKSLIYFWEISSGRQPFQSLNTLGIIFHASKGEREIPKEGAPNS
ncbi:hypothetical protein C2G38_2251616 [Gigaspora rosea]|uniref:Serine-threonine/tyrosine-protein kinase catalytic domain-containing protein n=1 Tax=Gigaspora rosea TaxID=44941 RepID=A0A397UFK4_9GLOM|nr:hypothetical protein C2G38_2251616 [Gigaspora rosea]